MSATANSSGRSSRTRSIALVTLLVAVGVAARGRDAQESVQPPATPDSAVADSVVQPDSMAMMDSVALIPPAVEMAPVAAPTTWPVDPATGQTLINGKPVVGRVFVMQKVDGVTKYENVRQVISREALAPLPARVGASHTPAPAQNVRRMRGVMIQSNLWDLDTKPSAVERRYFRTTTPASSLPQ